MRQTQTKYFHYSDMGLDFCSGSRAVFPDRFKKMLALGYNVKTVQAVTVSGDEVTLDYATAHGYSDNRVLQVDDGDLALINGGQFWVDSVTETTVTFTLPGYSGALVGGFSTRVASLGWELVYEQDHIHIYKMRHFDDTDMYVRFCFQDLMTSGRRNCVAVGVGKTVDLTLGHITDPNTYGNLGVCNTVLESNDVRWDFTNSTSTMYNNYTYSQGFSQFGQGQVIGSIYHIVVQGNGASSVSSYGYVYGVLPFRSVYPGLDYPVLQAANNGAATTSMNTNQLTSGRMYIGSYRCLGSYVTASYVYRGNVARASYLPPSLDNFATTTCMPVNVFTYDEGAYIGSLEGGLYQACYADTDRPVANISASPSITTEVDYQHLCGLHTLYGDAWLVAPVEPLK